MNGSLYAAIALLIVADLASQARRNIVPLLTLISGLAWTIVYIESIRVGFRDKAYAMPIAALALNFAWEST
jgi:hypothetical protein